MAFVFRHLEIQRVLGALALVICSGLSAIGCAGSTDGGGSVPPIDDPEGTMPGDAIVIVPDGAGISGAINFGGDVDWFTFRAGQGIVYTLQVTGLAPDPALLSSLDLTIPGNLPIFAQIVDDDGATQIANTSGTDGGDPYDIDVAPLEAPAGTVIVGGSRFIWVSPTTNDYFIRLQHFDLLTGIGHYEMRLSSSQQGRTDTGRLQWGTRQLNLFNDDGVNVYNGPGTAGIQFGGWDFLLGGSGPAIGWAWFPIFFMNEMGVVDMNPQNVATHIHWGIPNIFQPEFSMNFQDCGGDPHCWAFNLATDVIPDDVIRLIASFPFYVDIHITDNFVILPTPVSVTWPNGDIYSLFETEMAMSESNVIFRDGSQPGAERGFNPDFTLFYDSSLKTIQIDRRTYDPVFGGGIIPADAESFAGDILTVWARGSRGLGPIVPPSVIPVPDDPPTLTESEITQVEPGPGFRNEIRQLSDSEAEDLRDAYYSGGIYFEVTDSVTGQPISRADAAPLRLDVPSLEIQNVPFPEIFCPICERDDEPLRKGTINFASDYSGGGQITVYSNGKMLGVLNDYLEAGQEPECGETHTGLSLAAEYWPHRYPYIAVAEDGTEWKGHFEIQSGGCETLVLSVE